MREFVLYRLRSRAGRLLYVGQSVRPKQRLGDHRREQPWWSEVARIDLERFPTAYALGLAEWRAISTEKPRYNQAPGRRPVPPEEPVTIAAGGVYDETHPDAIYLDLTRRLRTAALRADRTKENV